SKTTFRSLAALRRGECSIIVQLRTGHVALRAYLNRFGHSDSPNCLLCNEPETVEHFLVTCQRFRAQQ
ncbi:hypothetical protein BS47DRAFT_1282621, partial [Hydnum rufescens UP504]